MKPDKMAEVFKALGDLTRLSILLELAGKESVSSGEIAKKFQTTWATVSRHLNILRKAKLITLKRESQNMLYSVNHKFLLKVLKNLHIDLHINTQDFLDKIQGDDDKK